MHWDGHSDEQHPCRALLGATNFIDPSGIGSSSFDAICVWEFRSEAMAIEGTALGFPNDRFDHNRFGFRSQLGRFVIGASSKELLALALETKNHNEPYDSLLDHLLAGPSDVIILPNYHSVVAYWNSTGLLQIHHPHNNNPFPLLVLGGAIVRGNSVDGRCTHYTITEDQMGGVEVLLMQMLGIVLYV